MNFWGYSFAGKSSTERCGQPWGEGCVFWSPSQTGSWPRSCRRAGVVVVRLLLVTIYFMDPTCWLKIEKLNRIRDGHCHIIEQEIPTGIVGERYAFLSMVFLHIFAGAGCSTWQWRIGKISVVLPGLIGHSQLSCLGLRVALQVWPFPAAHHQGWPGGAMRKMAGGAHTPLTSHK